MAIYEGYSGTIAVGGALNVCKRWRVRQEADKEEITHLGQNSAWRSYAGKLQGWTLEAEGDLDSADTQLRGAPPTLRAGVTASFLGAAATKFYGGIIFVDSVEVEGNADGVFGYTISATGTGALTYPAS